MGLSMLGRGLVAAAVSEIRLLFYLEKGRGVGWGHCCCASVPVRKGSRCVLRAQLLAALIPRSGEGGGDILAVAWGGGAWAVGWPANSKQEYM